MGAGVISVSLMASRDTTVLKLGSTCERAVMTAVLTHPRWKWRLFIQLAKPEIGGKEIYSYVKFDVVFAGASV